jgi:hypothetical protein
MTSRSLSDEVMTCEECCGSLLPEDSALVIQPWMNHSAPEGAQARLMEGDPGIWTISDMFDQYFINRLMEAVLLAGDEHFGHCAGVSHAHLDEKDCFRLSRDTAGRPKDEELVTLVMDKLATLWPSQEEQRDYMYARRTKPLWSDRTPSGCQSPGLQQVHHDNHHPLSQRWWSGCRLPDEAN